MTPVLVRLVRCPPNIKARLLTAALGCAVLASSPTGAWAQQHLVVKPPTLDFRVVPAGLAGRASALLSNDGDADLTITKMALLDPNRAGFAWVTAHVLPMVVAPKRSVLLALELQPGPIGERAGSVEATSDDPGQPKVSIPIHATAGDTLMVTPPVVDFGPTCLGGAALANLSLDNRGPSLRTVTIRMLDFNSAFGPADALQDQYIVIPGKVRAVPLRYGPTREGAESASAIMDTGEGLATVPMTGYGWKWQPPEPATIDFGAVPRE